MIKKETTSVNRSHNLNFDTRVTKGEREVSKIRANTFFKLKPGEFIAYADGKDRKVQFPFPKPERHYPVTPSSYNQKTINTNYTKIFDEVKSIFKS